MVLEYFQMNDCKIDEINVKGVDDENMVEVWNQINFNRLFQKIHHIVSSGNLEKVSWQNELVDLFRRIIPGKTFNLWEESLEKEYFQRPKGEKLLHFLRDLENKKLQIIYKSVKETQELEIKELDIINFLDRDFLFLGDLKKNSEVVERPGDDCEWCCRTSTSLPEMQVSSIHNMLTVINNKIFYLEKFIW